MAIPKGGNQKKVMNFDLWIVHLFKCFKMIHYFSRVQVELGVWAYGCWVVEREVGNLNRRVGRMFELGACNISQDSLFMRIY